jgi:hypothetical protein
MTLPLRTDGHLPVSPVVGIVLATCTFLGCVRPYTASYVCNGYGSRYNPVVECRVRESEVQYWIGPSGTAMPRSPRDLTPTREPAPTLDPRVLRAAVERVDLSPCRAEGVPDGFGHARLTLRPDGSVSKVHIDAPSGMTREAALCLGTELGAARVPPFSGSSITVGTTFLVRDPATRTSSR